MSILHLMTRQTEMARSYLSIWKRYIDIQIDYILFRKKWGNSVKNSRTYSTFSTVGSDHRIVSSPIKLSLRASKKSHPHPIKSIDWKEVASNADLSKQFAVAVYNRFEALSANADLQLNN